jgi:hypothetical protein
MMFTLRIIESVGLTVYKPMKLVIDNKGAIDYVNTWSSGGRMRHSCIKLNFLRELKEESVIEVEWCKTENMPADLFTKNLGGSQFRKHAAVFCSDVEYG